MSSTTDKDELQRVVPDRARREGLVAHPAREHEQQVFDSRLAVLRKGNKGKTRTSDPRVLE